MKKYLLLGLGLLGSSVFGQVTLEHSYVSDGYNDNAKQFAFFTANGLNYYTLDATTNQVKFYNASHVLWKTISVSPGNYEMAGLFLATDGLFNADAKVEFILKTQNLDTPYDSKMTLYNEDGTNLQEFGDFWLATVFKTSETQFKLIVSEDQGSENAFDVYSLPGTLSVLQQQAILPQQTFAYPNPSSHKINIGNPLLDGENGTVKVFATNGAKVMEQEVSGSQKTITLDISQLSKGTYLYKIGNFTSKFIRN